MQRIVLGDVEKNTILMFKELIVWLIQKKHRQQQLMGPNMRSSEGVVQTTGTIRAERGGRVQG